MKVVKNGRNNTLTKQSDIENEVRGRYYQQLYANKDENITFEDIESFMGEDLENIEFSKLTVVLIFFPGLVIDTYTNFQKNSCPKRASNHSLFATTHCN